MYSAPQRSFSAMAQRTRRAMFTCAAGARTISAAVQLGRQFKTRMPSSRSTPSMPSSVARPP